MDSPLAAQPVDVRYARQNQSQVKEDARVRALSHAEEMVLLLVGLARAGKTEDMKRKAAMDVLKTAGLLDEKKDAKKTAKPAGEELSNEEIEKQLLDDA